MLELELGGPQQFIICLVAKGVVDRLKPVQVDEKYPNVPVVVVGATQRAFEVVEQRNAVRQTGKSMVKGLVANLLFRPEPNDCRTEHGGDGISELDILLGEWLRSRRPSDLDQRKRPVSPADGNYQTPKWPQ